jgi:hypothetical protein
MPMPIGRTAGTGRDRRPGSRLDVRRVVAAFVAMLAGFAACYVRVARRWESGWRAWARLARGHYVRPDSNDYSVQSP